MAGESNIIPNKRIKGRDGKFGGAATGQNSQWAKVTATYVEDQSLAPNEIRYKYLGNSSGASGKPARPYHHHYATTPLINEIVEIIPGPDQNSDGRVLGIDYYMPVLNLWNSPHHGATVKGNSPNVSNVDFEERGDINPMHPLTGDLLIQGRRGQSLRFSETKSNTATSTPLPQWQTSQENSKPVIALVNGQTETTSGGNFLLENVNTDPSSIYLLQHSSLPLSTRTDWVREDMSKSSYGSSQVPADIATYEGNQVIITSGRLVFNAREESTLLTSEKSINLLANRLHFDAPEVIHFDSPVLRLTGDSRDASLSRSAVRGEDIVNELSGLYSALDTLCKNLGTLAIQLDRPDLKISSTNVQLYVNQLKRNSLKNKLLSKRVFLT